MITTEFIFFAATVVFLLMLIGIILTMHEFEKLAIEDDQRKDAASGREALRTQENHAGRS